MTYFHMAHYWFVEQREQIDLAWASCQAFYMMQNLLSCLWERAVLLTKLFYIFTLNSLVKKDIVVFLMFGFVSKY